MSGRTFSVYLLLSVVL